MPKLPVYNMPSGAPFLRSLAAGLTARLGDDLPRALVFLPTRRAVRALGDAFVQHAIEDGRGVALLPRMRPLADIDPEEPPFEPGELVGVVAPAMPSAQRRFDMARIVSRYHGRISELPLTPAGALGLADQLLSVMDDAAMDEVTLSGADKLEDMRARAAEHYQNAAKLFEIVGTHWPQYLSEQNMMEPMARRVALLNALTDHWTESPPDYPVIIAGSTGTLKATARLMRCVARLKDSAIILPGLDPNLRGEVWDKVSDQHPQNSLKRLIATIGVELEQVDNWSPLVDAENMSARRRVLSEALVPADSADDWPGRIATLRGETPGDVFEKAFDGLSVIHAQSDEEEALTIALIMRDTLETQDATAALVTPDPALARRVKAKLRRWDVQVDYSQGEPLEETQLGAYLAGLLRVTLDPENPVDLAFLAKHPLTQFGQEPGKLKRDWERLERKALRGPRKSFAALKRRFEAEPSGDNGAVFNSEKNREAFKNVSVFTEQAARLASLDAVDAVTWAQALAQLAEHLTAPPQEGGASQLWRGDAGEKAASIITSVMNHGASLGELSAEEFADLFSSLMRGKVVRPRYGMDPRLQVLGPLEARMLEADLVILGGLNETVWPAAPSIEPFLSYGMRRELGMSLPERRFGLQAHDFAELASNPKVILTRAAKSDSGPAVASRWLWRLSTLAKGALDEGAEAALAPPKPYLEWARALDFVKADDVKPVSAPRPNPPIEARWPKPKGRELAVTRLTTLVRDPYAHYARTVLGLPVLDTLDAPIGALEMGIAVHDSLEAFAKTHKDSIDDNSQALIADMFAEKLAALGVAPEFIAAQRPRLDNMARKFCDWCAASRLSGWEQAGIEVTGTLTVDGTEGEFLFTAKSDRIDQRGANYQVVDYKTGLAPKDKIVKAGFDIQLPLQAAMLEAGGFENIKTETQHGETEDLVYLSLRGHTQEAGASSIVKEDWTVERFINQAVETIEKLVDYFDDPGAIYHAQPRIQFSNEYGDYDHLSRRAEWAKAGGESEAGSTE